MSQSIQQNLNPAFEKAINDYLKFSTGEAPTETKEFNTYHTACKAALLHIALLIKLTQKEIPTEEIIPNLSTLLEQAKKELNTNDFSGISLDLG